MPTKKQCVWLQRLQKQLDFDHPGVRNRPISTSRRTPGKVKHLEQHALLDQPFFVLNDVAYANILKDLQSGARYVYSYAGLSSRPGYIDPKVPRFKNILGADGRSIERDVCGERRPVYSHAEFMHRFR